ncbi:probable 20S rRNA accumulation protein 4 isoform X1 [Phragmites australis]|uniref:probable 20S rRNA accumulation protein 4 isoform X1 n=1 Tax=Phragmites australis TaxID=29695 RepID=UPI002D77ED4A|nr:probable 20S rRNA accumulation protein 4 isoform X1 [Phragmites australis]
MEEVHLGLPGPWAEDYREKADHYTTKIGGVPDWPTDISIEPESLQCSLCGTKLCLVAQVYAPVAKLNIEERTIYVLVCPTPKCGPNPQSWKVLRVQKCHSDMKTDVSGDALDPSSGPTSTSFSEENNGKIKSPEISDDDFDLDALAEALEQAATLASNSKKQNKPKRSNAPIKRPVIKEKAGDPSIPVLPCFYIYYDKEQYGGKSTVASSSNELVLAKEIADTENDEEEKWEGEKYEYDKAIGADRTFLKFKKRLDAYPQQCFRYSYGGKPLSAATKLQDAGMCRLCGSPRQYELQLMSPLSYFLHEAGNDSSNYAANNWTWLTLIIYTCSKSCCASSCGGKPHSCCWGVAEEEMMIQEDEAL